MSGAQYSTTCLVWVSPATPDCKQE